MVYRSLSLLAWFSLLTIGSQDTALAAPQPATTDADAERILFLGPTRPIFLSISVRLDGDSCRAVRARYAQELFVSLDRDRDGLANPDEAKALSSLAPIAGRTISEEERASIDSEPRDGQISPVEFAAYLDKLLGSPFSIVAKAERVTQSVEVFPLLDGDGDGRLTPAEVEAGSRALQKLDVDDDQTFAVDELDPLRNLGLPGAVSGPPLTDLPFRQLDTAEARTAAATLLLQRYDSERDALLSPPELGMTAAQITQSDADGEGTLNAAELATFLKAPPCEVELSVQLPFAKPGRPGVSQRKAGSSPEVPPGAKQELLLDGMAVEVRGMTRPAATYDNRQFYKLRFRTQDTDKNKYLDEQEFATLGLENASFGAVDVDGDSQVFEAELLTYIDRDASASRVRIVMTVADEGKSLFELIDGNRDRRLSPRELREGFARLKSADANQDAVITPTELDGRYRITYEVGKVALFQDRNNPAPVDAATPLARPTREGPDWFRKMDRNRDSDVSPREFLGPAAAFTRLDANADGLISVEEAGESASP